MTTRERPMTRVRLAEITLKRLWNRQRLSEQFLAEVSEWLLSAGWALIFAGSTHAAVRIDAVENWPAVSSKLILDEVKAAANGRGDFKKLEYLFQRAAARNEDAG